MTFNQILQHFRDFQENHLQIKHFLFGDNSSVDNTSDIDGVVMLVMLDSTAGSISNYQFSYSFQVAFMDVLNKNNENLEDVLSDTLQIGQDFVAWLAMYSETALEYDFDRNVQIQAFRDRFETEYGGHVIGVRLQMPFNYDKCQIPTVDGESLPTACELFLGRLTSDQLACIAASELFEYTYIINVNGVQSANGVYNPLDNNTFNISA